MAGTYITAQGETWDDIAYKLYGDEDYADFLMENNYRYLDVLVFSSGTVLNTPDLPEDDETGVLPPWRMDEDEDDEDYEDPYDDYDDEEDDEDEDDE